MKKLSILIAVLLTALALPAQTYRRASATPGFFGPKTWFVDAGIGLGIERYQFTDKTNNHVDPRDTSGSIEIPIQVEYGITNWLGAAVITNFSHFIEGDSAGAQKASGFDFAPGVNLHIPWSLKKLDVYANINYGYSHFAYRVNNSTNDKAIANGSVLYTGLNMRWMFRSEGHFGMNFWYHHANFNYPNGTISNDTNTPVQKFKLDGPGNLFGLGFFGRF